MERLTVYLISGLLHRIKQGRKYQIAEATVLSLEHPWFAFSLGRGGRIRYRIHYRFAVSEGRVVEGEDWVRSRRSYSHDVLVAYEASDPNSNRIYERSGAADLWLQLVVGVVCLLAGGVLVFVSFAGFKSFLF